MSIDITDDQHETTGEPVALPEQLGDPGRLVEVRRRPVTAAALGAGASLVAVAYLARAVAGGGAVDWLLAAALGVIGIANLAALLDARTPLLVADGLGLRLRLGRTWVGLPWGGLHEVVHRERRGWWRDGLLTVRTHYVQRVLEDLDPGARRIARINARLHGSPLAVPLGLGTRVVGARPDLTSALRELADGRTPVVEEAADEAHDQAHDQAHDEVLDVTAELAEEPQPRRVPDPRPAIAHLIGVVAARFDRSTREHEGEVGVDVEAGLETGAATGLDVPLEVEPEVVASETPAPTRETVVAARAEVRHESRADLGEVFEEDTRLWGDLHAISKSDGEMVLDDDLLPPHVTDPVIGPQFAVARERLGLTVDELADRTRIRPHVIEAIEVDDFSACGGDFYARGHLRTLARVLGLDSGPLLATYDERYADAPIDPRRVFEAELAGAGSIRATRGGPNWSVLVAAVMALVLCWSVARLVTGGPDQGPDRAVLSGSGGPNHRTTVPVGKPVPVTLDAGAGGARVVVRDGAGKVVFSGDLAYGQRHTVQAATPVEVESTDGGLTVTVNGRDRGRMGPAGRPAHQSYSADR